jgi:hypothetical protein
MTRSFASLSLALALVACGGSQPEAEAPSSAEAAPADPAPAEPAAPAADSKPSGGDWEGEAEATSGSTPPPSKPLAAADTGVAETRTMDVIAKIVKDNRQPVRDCYDKARKELPTLKGDMVISFDLDPEGKVKKIELNQQRSTLKAPAVVDCAIATIKSLKFPASSRGMETSVNYPYNFNP